MVQDMGIIDASGYKFIPSHMLKLFRLNAQIEIVTCKIYLLSA